ncbi:hypothetical protein A0O36_00054 [Piscirickettsiaceae bacterium NZ-RLO1]|nr:hypothetical protein A0O36_00054 [Piscirickettsiaceae bacterium NZ-RLO1]
MLFDSTAEYAPTSSTLFTSVYRYRPFPTLVYDNTQQCHIDIAEEQDADTDCFFDATEEFYENLEESLEEVAACTAHQAEAADSTLFLLQVKAPLLQTHKPYQ